MTGWLVWLILELTGRNTDHRHDVALSNISEED